MRPASENPARRFFEARSVAVVGASRSPGKAGFHQVDNLRRQFTGEVYPVNPNADSIAGFRCYPSLDAIERSIDLAILLRPAGDVWPAFEACIAQGVPRCWCPRRVSPAVAVGIDSEPALRAAWRSISDSVATRAPDARLDGMMVQSMLQGREIIAGVTRVPGIGPVVMVGCGGVLVESRGEVAFRLPPFGCAEADRMMEESGVARVLGAHRGGPAGDRTAVRDLLVRLAALADAGIGIHEFEINPLIVGNEVEGAAAADALVVVEES